MGQRGLQKVTWFVGLPGYAGSDKKGTIASEEETYYSGEEHIYFLGVQVWGKVAIEIFVK